jgi:hypothetical protein
MSGQWKPDGANKASETEHKCTITMDITMKVEAPEDMPMEAIREAVAGSLREVADRVAAGDGSCIQVQKGVN